MADASSTSSAAWACPATGDLPEFKELWILASNSNGVKTLVRAKNALTVRMCLNHTGGFPFEICAKKGELKGGGWTGGAALRQVAAIAANSPILFEPGTKAQYSNTGIDIGAAVVEVITGMKWEDYLKKTVLDPLGMASTSFKPTDEQLKTQVEMYDCVAGASAKYRLQNNWQQRPYNGDHVQASAGAGLWTTANDQLKFYKMLMNLGMGDNGVRILKEETVKSMLAVSTRPQGLGGYSLGLSAPVEDNENGWFGHGGAWGTTCLVNYHRKQLRLWAVQLNGAPRPWDKFRDEAAGKFFSGDIDRKGAAEYTGRTKYGAQLAVQKRTDLEKVLDQFAVEHFFKVGDDFVANLVALDRHIVVGGIFTPGFAEFLQIRFQFAVAAAEQRAHEAHVAHGAALADDQIHVVNAL